MNETDMLNAFVYVWPWEVTNKWNWSVIASLTFELRYFIEKSQKQFKEMQIICILFDVLPSLLF